MLEKKESQRKTQTEMKSEIVNLLDIDTKEITFQNQSQTNTTEAKSACYTMEGQCLSNVKVLPHLV